MKTAIYDLGRMPTTFDFAVWAVIAKTSGCDHVHFVIEDNIAHWKYPADIAWKRFGNILIPICGMARMSYSVGRRMEGEQFPYLFGDVNRLYERTGKVHKLRSRAKVEKKGYITVTLRESFRNKYRDSDKAAWAKFISRVESTGKEVVVFEECEHAPIDLDYRMAFYADADMNLGVANGPMALCLMSDAPYLMFNLIPEKQPTDAQYDIKALLVNQGFGPESQLLFRNERQRIVWKPDHYEHIIEAYEAAFPQKEAA